MKISEIPFYSTKHFSQLILDYLDQKETLKEFYEFDHSLEGIHQAAKARKFSAEQRTLLVSRLKAQYEDCGLKLKEASLTLQNIDRLSEENTLTITTGHQLNLMGGPLYSLYKILSTIKLTNELSEKYNDFQFVPVFWMASEDHDFEEVDHFFFKGKKYQWKREAEGAVGRLDTKGLDLIFEQLKADLPDFSGHAEKILKLFKESYLHHENMAHASRALVHQLFSAQGLVIIDGDDAELKRSFIPEMKKELTSFSTEQNVLKQSQELAKNYKLQVNPRQINLFYLDQTRERIEKVKDAYVLVESKRKLEANDLLEDLEKHPERFSPNVLMRPMYQEKLLPNLAYIGGGGELAYWFQLKNNFEHFNLQFPVLILRKSVLYLNSKQSKIVKELELKWSQLFEREGDLIKKWVIEDGNEGLLLKDEMQQYENLWTSLKEKSLSEDASLGPYVEAQEKAMQRWLGSLSNKLIRSQRRKSEIAVEQIKELKSELFPNGSLQERRESLIELLMIKGDELIPELLETMNMPAKGFMILEL